MKNRSAFWAFPLLFCWITASAQSDKKMDIQLRTYLAQDHRSEEMVNLFIHGEQVAVSAAVRAVGGHVKMSLARIVSARVPVSRVAELANSPAVHHFEFSLDTGRLLNDSMRVKNRVNQVQEGQAPLHQGYTGSGVIMGYIDSGLDITHPDLRDANGNTRVLRYWDQNVITGPGVPAPFNYGSEWNSEQLDSGGPIPNDDATGHGTTVIGSGSGNGLANGRHKGVAPDADIVVVASALGSPNWRATIADAVAYILAVAEEEGKPVVINASLGTYSGSHDGLDAAGLFIQQLLNEQSGRAMVAAAGNSAGGYPFHTETIVDADTSFTWYTTNANGPQYNIFPFPNLFFEVWADMDEFTDVRFALGADRPQPSLAYRGRTGFHSVAEALNNTVTEPLVSSSGNVLGTVQFYAQERGDQVLLQVFMQAPDSASNLWRFITTGSGRFDTWTLTTFTATSNVIGPVLAAPLGLPFPTPAQYPDMAHYVEPDLRKHIVDSWACLPDVLTVGNYCNEVAYIDYAGNPQTVAGEEGNLALGSSSGPTRDNRLKPDITASGDITFTAGTVLGIQWIIANQNGWKIDPGGWHVRDGGTSMAAPGVAGAVALLLEKCPNATVAELGDAIRSHARQDVFTGAVPNDRWGLGKLDAFASVTDRTELTAETTAFCEGDLVEVAMPAEFSSVTWSDGSTEPIHVQEGEGELSAVFQNATGCASYSDTLFFTFLPAPAQPTIVLDGSTLTSSEAPGYQWYLNDELIPGATDQSWDAQELGMYTVEAIGANGCTILSEPQQVLTVGVVDHGTSTFALWPSPVRDVVNLQLAGPSVGAIHVTVIASDGKVVRRKRITQISGPMSLSVEGLAAGTYTLQAEVDGSKWSRRFVKLP